MDFVIEKYLNLIEESYKQRNPIINSQRILIEDFKIRDRVIEYVSAYLLKSDRKEKAVDLVSLISEQGKADELLKDWSKKFSKEGAFGLAKLAINGIKDRDDRQEANYHLSIEYSRNFIFEEAESVAVTLKGYFKAQALVRLAHYSLKTDDIFDPLRFHDSSITEAIDIARGATPERADDLFESIVIALFGSSNWIRMHEMLDEFHDEFNRLKTIHRIAIINLKVKLDFDFEIILQNENDRVLQLRESSLSKIRQLVKLAQIYIILKKPELAFRELELIKSEVKSAKPLLDKNELEELYETIYQLIELLFSHSNRPNWVELISCMDDKRFEANAWLTILKTMIKSENQEHLVSALQNTLKCINQMVLKPLFDNKTRAHDIVNELYEVPPLNYSDRDNLYREFASVLLEVGRIKEAIYVINKMNDFFDKINSMLTFADTYFEQNNDINFRLLMDAAIINENNNDQWNSSVQDRIFETYMRCCLYEDAYDLISRMEYESMKSDSYYEMGKTHVLQKGLDFCLVEIEKINPREFRRYYQYAVAMYVDFIEFDEKTLTKLFHFLESDEKSLELIFQRIAAKLITTNELSQDLKDRILRIVNLDWIMVA
jgi:hypothetical protein